MDSILRSFPQTAVADTATLACWMGAAPTRIRSCWLKCSVAATVDVAGLTAPPLRCAPFVEQVEWLTVTKLYIFCSHESPCLSAELTFHCLLMRLCQRDTRGCAFRYLIATMQLCSLVPVQGRTCPMSIQFHVQTGQGFMNPLQSQRGSGSLTIFLSKFQYCHNHKVSHFPQLVFGWNIPTKNNNLNCLIIFLKISLTI